MIPKKAVVHCALEKAASEIRAPEFTGMSPALPVAETKRTL
jgi:hypothetical protein